MAFLVQTLIKDIDLSGHSHFVLWGDGMIVSSPANHCIFYIENGVVNVWAGALGLSGAANGFRTTARFNSPSGMTKDNSGNIYISDTENHVIRKIDANGDVSIIAGQSGLSGFSGDGNLAVSALLDRPIGLSFSQVNLGGGVFNALFVLCANERIRHINLANGNIYLSRNGIGGTTTGYLSAFFRKPNRYYDDTTLVFIGNTGAPDVWWNPNGVLSYLYIDQNGILLKQIWGGNNGYYHVVNDSAFIDSDYHGKSPLHYFTSPENKIYKFLGASNSEVVFVGTGSDVWNGDREALLTNINNPTQLLNDVTGLYFIDSGNNAIRRVVQSELFEVGNNNYLLENSAAFNASLITPVYNLDISNDVLFECGCELEINNLLDLILNHEFIVGIEVPCGDYSLVASEIGFLQEYIFPCYEFQLQLNVEFIEGAFEVFDCYRIELSAGAFVDFMPVYNLVKSNNLNASYDLIKSKEMVAAYNLVESNDINIDYNLISSGVINGSYGRQTYRDLNVRYTHSEYYFEVNQSLDKQEIIIGLNETTLIEHYFEVKSVVSNSLQYYFESLSISTPREIVIDTNQTSLVEHYFEVKQSFLIIQDRYNEIFSGINQTKLIEHYFEVKQSLIASQEYYFEVLSVSNPNEMLFAINQIPLIEHHFEVKQSLSESVDLFFDYNQVVCHSLEYLFETNQIQTENYLHDYFFEIKESVTLFETPAGSTIIDCSNQHFWLELNGEKIEIKKYDISISNIEWAGQVEVNNEIDYLKLQINNVVYLHIPEQLFKLVVISKSSNKDGLVKRSYSISLKSPVVLFNDIKTTQEWNSDFASNIAASIYNTEWDLIDWKIPSKTLAINEGSPIASLKQLVESVGGFLASKPSGDLIARSTYKTPVNKWETSPLEFTIPLDFVFSESLTSQAIKRWNAVIVNSGTNKEISYTVETIEIDKTKYLICRPSIWREDIYLLHTSKYPTSFKYLGSFEDEVSEQIEIKEGKASISKPATELVGFDYHWKDLGDLEIIDNQVVLKTMPNDKIDSYSLLNIRYKTKYHKWVVGGGIEDTAQFLFITEKEL